MHEKVDGTDVVTIGRKEIKKDMTRVEMWAFSVVAWLAAEWAFVMVGRMVV